MACAKAAAALSYETTPRSRRNAIDAATAAAGPRWLISKAGRAVAAGRALSESGERPLSDLDHVVGTERGHELAQTLHPLRALIAAFEQLDTSLPN